jgi:Sigma-70, region 4
MSALVGAVALLAPDSVEGRRWPCLVSQIVRNTCSGWRGPRPAFDPETLLLQTDDAMLISRAMRHLPDGFHQLLVLRELQGLSYRELADAMEIPIGTGCRGCRALGKRCALRSTTS